VLGAAFLPDFFWLGLSVAGIEPVDKGVFFDGWSHPVLSIVVQAVAIGVFFNSWGVQFSWLGKSHYWWMETDITLLLLIPYAVLALRSGFKSNVVIASMILVGWIQLMFG